MRSIVTKPFLRDSCAGHVVKSACGITIDIGRQRLTAEDLKGLFKLAEKKGVLEANAKMRSGEIVNVSEHRPALHTALRDTSVSAPFHKEVTEALNHFCNFAEDVRSGLFCGCRGDAITDIINIGIGLVLGAVMVVKWGRVPCGMPFATCSLRSVCISCRRPTAFFLIAS